MPIRRLLLCLLLPALLAACACSDDNDDECDLVREARAREACKASRNPSAPTPLPEPPKVHSFEFRVTGTLSGATIALTSTSEGTTTLTTDVPWFATIRSTRTLMFLSLSAQASGYGTLTVQLFVDGVLFREATTTGFDPKVAISGQWTD